MTESARDYLANWCNQIATGMKAIVAQADEGRGLNYEGIEKIDSMLSEVRDLKARIAALDEQDAREESERRFVELDEEDRAALEKALGRADDQEAAPNV
jgi:outer membrane murein-binding lipoprotein Lpp